MNKGGLVEPQWSGKHYWDDKLLLDELQWTKERKIHDCLVREFGGGDGVG